MEVGRWEKIQAELFNNKLGLNVLPRIDLHIVMFTVIDGMLRLCSTSTAMTVLMFITACTKWLCGRKVGDEEAKL